MSNTKQKNGNGGMFSYLKNNFSLVKDVAIVLGMMGVLYLNSHYVSNERFESQVQKNEAAHVAITTTLVSIDKTLALMTLTQSSIDDIKTEMKVRSKQIDELVAQNRVDAQYNVVIDKVSTDVAELKSRIREFESLNLKVFMQDSAVHRAKLEERLKDLESHISVTK